MLPIIINNRSFSVVMIYNLNIYNWTVDKCGWTAKPSILQRRWDAEKGHGNLYGDIWEKLLWICSTSSCIKIWWEDVLFVL